MRNSIKGLMTLGVAAAMAGCMGTPAGTANAPMPASFDTWDRNDDGLLDEGEFGVNWGNAGTFDSWDANRDSVLDNNEWATGVGDWDEMAVGSYLDWDRNRDGMLDRDEFDTGVFNTLDTADDGFLDEGEWQMGMNLW